MAYGYDRYKALKLVLIGSRMVWALFLFKLLFLAMTPVSLKDILIDLWRVLATDISVSIDEEGGLLAPLLQSLKS